MTENEIIKIKLQAYLRALKDVYKIIEEIMENSIEFYEQKINEHLENHKNE